MTYQAEWAGLGNNLGGINSSGQVKWFFFSIATPR